MYEWLPEGEGCDDTWRIICDLSMFGKAICLTLLDFSFLGKEDIEDIRNCLLDQFLRYDFFEERYEIAYCPTDTMHYEHDPFCLRFCFIAFILRQDKRKLIDRFIEASFLLNEKYEISEEEKEQFQILLADKCKEELVELYRMYSPASWRNIVILRRYCERVFLFVQNGVSRDSHRY